jgi:polar amino acid transport system permease protein
MHRWDFGPVFDNAGLLLAGLGNTLALTAAALACGLPVGLALAAARLSGRAWLAAPAGVVIEVFRTTPPLVQLFWFYFGLPIVLNVEMTPFLAALLTFCIQSGAFFAEIFRAGIVSIDRGQREAGRAIGMTGPQCFRRIILPQAVKRMFPAFMERSIELMKTTTLVAAISHADLLYQANEIAQKTFRPLEVLTAAALMYFAAISLMSLAASRLERRFALSGDMAARP